MRHIDIIIISNAKNEEFLNITNQTIQTLLLSENPDEIQFHPIIVESNDETPDYNYPNAVTIRPNSKFGYHKYLNIGVKAGNSPYLGLANNDLIFHKGWASAILSEMDKNPKLESAGTWCDRFHPSRNISESPEVQFGYTNGIYITGWFIFLKRSLFDRMNGLDENFSFWYCDDDYGKTLESMDVKHALITQAKVTHITSQSTIKLDPKEFRKLTLLPNLYFDYKWNHRSYLIYLIKRLIFYFRLKWNLTR
jgi:GT2 family glycosyltransferase